MNTSGSSWDFMDEETENQNGEATRRGSQNGIWIRVCKEPIVSSQLSTVAPLSSGSLYLV